MKKAKQFKPSHGVSTGPKFNGRKNIDEMYDSTWSAYAKNFIAINKNCYACFQPAEVCDHLKPHKGDTKLFKQTDNHIPLCHRCHNTITTLFDRMYRPGSTIDPKLKWIAATRNINRVPIEYRVKVMPKYGE